MLLFRIDAPIFFANVEGIKDYLLDKLEQDKDVHKRAGDVIQYVIIDLSPSPDIDVAAIHMFEEFVESMKSDGIKLILANPTKSVVSMLRRGELLELLGPGGVQASVGDAVKYARSHLTHGGTFRAPQGAV